MISRNHYIIHDIMGVNISTDIICLWYHENDIKDCHLWYHDCHIRIWFHGIITSYMISWVQISVLISQCSINDIIYWFYVIMSSLDFNALHLVWCHVFDVIIWCHRLWIGCHAM